MSFMNEAHKLSVRQNLASTTAAALLIGLGLAAAPTTADAACNEGASTINCSGTINGANVFDTSGISAVNANNGLTINNGRLRVNETSANITFNGTGVIVNNGNGTLNATDSNGVIHINTQGTNRSSTVNIADSTVVVTQGRADDGSQGVTAQTNPSGNNSGNATVNATNTTVDMQTANSRAGLNANTSGNGAAIINMAGGWVKTNGNLASGPIYFAGVRANSDLGDAIVNLSEGAFVESINRATGISAQSGGSGNASITIEADAGGTIEGQQRVVSTTGEKAYGLYAEAVNGTVTITNVSTLPVAIETQGDNASAIFGTINGSGSITIDNLGGVQTSGTESNGIYATITGSGAGAITVDNQGVIQTAGDTSSGILAKAVTGDVTITNSAAITTAGVDATGISGSTGGIGNVTITNSADIITSGSDGAAGIYGLANGTGNVIISSTDADITTSGTGQNNHGIEAVAPGGNAGIAFSNGTVTVAGQSSGLSAWNNDSGQDSTADVTVTSGTVEASGTYGHNAIQALAQTSASVSIDAASAVHGGWINDGAAGTGVALGGLAQSLVNDGTIDSLSDIAVRGDANGVSGTFDIANSGTITGSVGAETSVVTFDNSGTWNVRGFADTTGDGVRDALSVAVSDFGTSGANVINNTGTLMLQGDNGEAQTLDSTGAYQPFGLAMTDMAIGGPAQGHILGVTTFNHSGVIDLTGGTTTPGNVLVISGGQTAGSDGGGVFVTNGGTILFNTVLNEGGAASQSDILVLDSTQMGSAATTLVVNTSGSGALTVGNGIPLIEVLNKGASAPDVFTLANGPLVGGAYRYSLYHNGVGADSADGNWYLRSSITIEKVDPVFVDPEDPKNPKDPENPATPAAPSSPQVVYQEVPDYRPSFPVLASITPLASEYGFSMLNGISGGMDSGGAQRGGDPLYEERSVWCKDPRQNFRCIVKVPVGQADAQKWFPGAWARVVGVRGVHDNNQNFERRGPDYDYTFWGVQAGLDVYGRETEKGSMDRVGVYVGYGQIDSDIKGAWSWSGKAGTVDMDAYTVGGYWRHRYEQGFYTNAVIQGTWYSADAKTYDGYRYEPDGFGILGSLEGGYTLKVGNGIVIEPQAQVVYQQVSFDNVADSNDIYKNTAYFQLDDGESLRGRLGVRIAKGWDIGSEGAPRLLTLWGRANVWHEFMGEHKTTVTDAFGQNPVTVDANLEGTWGEIEAGIKGEITETVMMFASGGYNHSLDNKGRESWNGRLGVKVHW